MERSEYGDGERDEYSSPSDALPLSYGFETSQPAGAFQAPPVHDQ